MKSKIANSIISMITLLCVLTISGINAEEIAKPGSVSDLTIEHDRPGKPAKLYVPSDYNPVKKWPLIISMHGMNGSPTFGPWKKILNGKGFFIAGLNYADVEFDKGGKWPGRYVSTVAKDKYVRDYIATAIEKIASQYNIDRNVILYAGNSMGGWNVGPFCFNKDAESIYRGYILWGGRPYQVDGADYKYAKGKPFMAFHGESCYVLTENPKLMESDIQNIAKAGADVTRKIYKGQGHSVSADSCGDDVRKWFNEIILENMLNDGYSPIEWKSAVFTEKLEDASEGAMSEYIKKQEFVSKDKESKPTLIWLYSTKCNFSKNKAKPSSEVSKCDKAYEKTFVFPDCVNTLNAAKLFDCVAINMSDIDKKENPILNSNSCPMIILVSQGGEQVKFVTKSISDPSVYKAMSEILSDDQKKELAKNYKELSSLKSQWKKLGKDIKTSQKKLFKTFQKYEFNDQHILEGKTRISEEFAEADKLLQQLNAPETK